MLLEKKKGRARIPPVCLPSDWVDVIYDIFWQEYAKAHPGVRKQLKSDRENFQSLLRFPKGPTFDRAKRTGEMTEQSFNAIALALGYGKRGSQKTPHDLRCLLRSRSKDPELSDELQPSNSDRTCDLRVFLSRSEIQVDNTFARVMGRCRRLDMIAVSAAVAGSIYATAFREALKRPDLHCRFVIFDPSERTAGHYDAFVSRILWEEPATKRGQATSLFEFVEEAGGRLEIKVIRDLPMMYNAWIAQDGKGIDYIAHLSHFFYDHRVIGPAFRGVKENPLIQLVRQEFDYVWSEVAVPYSSQSRSKEKRVNSVDKGK